MKVYEIPAGGRSLDELRRVERPDPEPGPGQVLVRVRAASLNFRDQAVVTGNYFGGAVQRDTIPLSDGAGEVVSTGRGVTCLRTGDRVASTFFLGWIDGPPAGIYSARGSPYPWVGSSAPPDSNRPAPGTKLTSSRMPSGSSNSTE